MLVGVKERKGEERKKEKEGEKKGKKAWKRKKREKKIGNEKTIPIQYIKLSYFHNYVYVFFSMVYPYYNTINSFDCSIHLCIYHNCVAVAMKEA